MAPNPIIFACANPVPEIMPELALEAGAAVIATGRSDYPNQINNVLAFPGVFRGALDVRASDINDTMKLAAAYAIAGLVSGAELKNDHIIPSALDPRVGPAVAAAVAKAARESGVARI
jgi:malate dehydrogenase (oxaloacetate-decarboxylating)